MAQIPDVRMATRAVKGEIIGEVDAKVPKSLHDFSVKFGTQLKEDFQREVQHLTDDYKRATSGLKAEVAAQVMEHNVQSASKVAELGDGVGKAIPQLVIAVDSMRQGISDLTTRTDTLTAEIAGSRSQQVALEQRMAKREADADSAMTELWKIVGNKSGSAGRKLDDTAEAMKGAKSPRRANA